MGVGLAVAAFVVVGFVEVPGEAAAALGSALAS
jgi:hypothetical protein